MNIYRVLAACVVILLSQCLLSFSCADAKAQTVNNSSTLIQVYKGELAISVAAEKRDSLLIQYRAKNREVMRIGVTGLELTNTATKQVTRLRDQTAGLGNRIDAEGYWIIDLHYDGLRLAADNYRVSGKLTQYLSGSQRSRDFSVYLQPETASKPADSTIDWGSDN